VGHWRNGASSHKRTKEKRQGERRSLVGWEPHVGLQNIRGNVRVGKKISQGWLEGGTRGGGVRRPDLNPPGPEGKKTKKVFEIDVVILFNDSSEKFVGNRRTKSLSVIGGQSKAKTTTITKRH